MIEGLPKKIIDTLNADARKSYREIARNTGSSVTAVRNSLKELEEKRVIRGYIPVIDPAAVGLDLSAVIAIRISHGQLLEEEKKIAEDPHVFAVYDVTGAWDCLVLARFRGRYDLSRFIKKLTAFPNVDRTDTHVVLNIVKDERRVFP